MSINAQREVGDTPPGVLADTVTPVTNGPATFSAGVVPNTKKELDLRYTTASDLGGSASAWSAVQWVKLSSGRTYTWNGTAWVTSNLATGVAAGTTERLFTGGRWPQTKAELDTIVGAAIATGGAAFLSGRFITLEKSVANGGTEKYYWNGTAWLPGQAP